MFYAKYPIEGVKKIYKHSIENPVFDPTFSQMFEGRYRKDGKDIPVGASHWPKVEEVDKSKLPRQFLCVKDEGNYIMAATEETLPGEKTANFVVYCEGCNPEVDDDYWLTQQEAFGGDDFAEGLPLEGLEIAIENAEKLGIDVMIIKVTKDRMELVTGRKL